MNALIAAQSRRYACMGSRILPGPIDFFSQSLPGRAIEQSRHSCEVMRLPKFRQMAISPLVLSRKTLMPCTRRLLELATQSSSRTIRGAPAAYGALAAEPGRWRRAVIGNVPPYNVFGPAALLAALQLEMFTALGDSSMAGEELAAAIGVRPRRLLPILNVLVLMGLLRREGERYVNGEEAAHYLVKGKPSYIGGIHELYSDLYRAVLLTADSIRSDRPVAEHDFTQMSDEALASFFRGLHGISIVQGRELAKQYDFSRFERLVDVGGGSGSMAIGACEVCPALRATVLELIQTH